jgi:hypothetical protein
LIREAETLVARNVETMTVSDGQRLNDHDDAGKQNDHHHHVGAIPCGPFLKERRDRAKIQTNVCDKQ